MFGCWQVCVLYVCLETDALFANSGALALGTTARDHSMSLPDRAPKGAVSFPALGKCCSDRVPWASVDRMEPPEQKMWKLSEDRAHE